MGVDAQNRDGSFSKSYPNPTDAEIEKDWEEFAKRGRWQSRSLMLIFFALCLLGLLIPCIAFLYHPI